MSNIFIYSYRITYFGGTAPCYDAGYLSLAICKRDMRRVVGRRFLNNKNNDSFWIVGIVGNSLGDDDNFKDKTGDILYIAKVDDVKNYSEYFGNTQEKRSDKIYKPCHNGNREHNGVRFAHNGCDIHSEEYLQERDWDEAHKNKNEKFVLISNHYCFLDKTDSDKIKSIIGNNLAKGVGHKVTECSDDITESFIEILKAKQHGILNLPEKLRNNKTSKRGCGKDKGI